MKRNRPQSKEFHPHTVRRYAGVWRAEAAAGVPSSAASSGAHPGELSARRAAVAREDLKRGIARFLIARSVHRRALAAVNESFGKSR